jgi:uncharacterized DUF497 family protein
MKFVWDPVKARTNLAKHGISFEIAQEVWDDPLSVVSSDFMEDGEERWHAIGMVRPMLLLLVVHTYPDPDNDGLVRIISARKAIPYERKRYEQEGS